MIHKNNLNFNEMKISTKIMVLLFAFFLMQNALAQLSGTKTIGGTSPDYTTIGNAITALKTNGINGNITFNIRDGVYNELLDITGISGSETYTIIFQSESQDTSKVKITYSATAGNTYLVNLTRIKNITFQYLTFKFTGNYTCKMVYIHDSAVNVKFLNNYFKCLNRNAYIVYGPQPQSGEKAYRALEFTNNTFEQGYSAIELYGGYYGVPKNIIITNNIFKDQDNNGIYLSSCEGTSIKSNSITSVTSVNYDVSAFGIGLEYGIDFEIIGNKLYTSYCYGILLKECSNTSALKRAVNNNFVTTKVDPLGMGGQAMGITSSAYADVIYNSFRLIGGATGMTNYGLLVSGSSNINVVNNIFYNNEYYAVSLDSKTGITSWDYNYLFSKSNTMFARYNGSSYSSLSAWQTASTLDAHSVTGTLSFTSASDLHVNTKVVNAKATPWGAVTTDIDNELRNATTPDIGADEFTILNSEPVIANQTFTIDENLTTGSTVDTVVATDPDAGQVLTYSIIAGNTSNAFSINSSSGQITVNTSSAINYEVNPSFALSVRVQDNGIGTLSDTAIVTVNLTNLNEAPVIANQTFNINEGIANGSAVGTVIASDPDAGQTLTYSITAGNTSNAFSIDSPTGVITVNTSSALDYETTPVFTLTVQVQDNGAGALSSSATVTINLNKVNEYPVINNQSFSILENLDNGSAAGTVVASDPDAAQTLTYSITAGNTSNAFSINSSTGVITVNTSSALDYETTPVFTLTVQVQDNGAGALSSSATVTISLINVNEPTGVNSLSIADNSWFYPNPSNGIINFDPGLLLNNNISIEVYDLAGRIVFKQEKINQNTVILTNESGVFTIRLIINQKIYNQKIIIRK
jgi:hypothetical protein